MESKKINDQFRIENEIDLNEFCETKGNNQYVLHAIIVHEGVSNSGHYYSYIHLNN